MLVIPAIDLKDGQCVRLRQGRMEDSTVFSDDPVEMAVHWLERGAKRLHIVDLNGAFEGTPVNAEIVTAIAKTCPQLPIQIGGGIRNLESVRFYIEAGVSFVIIGTAAVKDPDFVKQACEAFPEKIIVGLDAFNGKVATEGWSDVSEVSVVEVDNKYADVGVSALVYTDIARDGMMQGCNIEATVKLAEQSPVPIIASGGIAKLADIVDLRASAKTKTGAGIIGAITGRAIYEGKLDLTEAQAYCNAEEAQKMALAKRIIPCLDCDKGRVVKGVKFVDIRDAGDPVEVAKRYCEEGADEITFLDITASHEDRATTVDTVRAIAGQVFIPLTVGGGIRKLEDIRTMLNAGADKVAINTAAVSNPEFVREAAARFGSQCTVVAVDAKQVSSKDDSLKWEIFTHGGRNSTGLDAIDWVKRMVDCGAGEILLTSMDRDGTKIGFDLALNKTVSQAVQVPIIASGGVGNLEHLAEGVLVGEADAVLAASIFHFGEYSIAEAKKYMASKGIEIRL